MSVTPSAFKAEFTEFSTLSDTVVQTALTLAALQINAATWADKSDAGTKYLAAHQLAVDGKLSASGGLSVAAGSVASETVGSVSRSYSSAATSGVGNAELARTSYGMTFLRLRSTVIATPFVC